MLRGGSGPSWPSVSATDFCCNGEAQWLRDEASGEDIPEARDLEQGMDLPVSVSPSHLDFYVDEKNGDTLLLSLFNVSQQTVYFQLMSNEPARYGFTGRSGIITAHCYSEIEVHYFGLSEEHVGTRDNLRIVLCEQEDRILGFVDVPVNVWPKRGRSDDESEEEAPAAVLPRGSTHTQQLPRQDWNNSWALSGHLPLLMFVVLVCVVALLLPLKGTLDASSHPLLAYFSLSHKLKLVAAYILGDEKAVLLHPTDLVHCAALSVHRARPRRLTHLADNSCGCGWLYSARTHACWLEHWSHGDATKTSCWRATGLLMAIQMWGTMQPDEARIWCSTKPTALVPGHTALLEESIVMADDNQPR